MTDRRGAGLRLLQALLPPAVRESAGPGLLAFWSQQRREDRYRGWFGGARFWASLVWEVVVAWARVLGQGGRALAGARGGVGVTSELRHAIRMLTRAPLHSWSTITTLALGVGVTVAVFSAVKSVVLDPLPYPDAHELVSIERYRPNSGSSSVPWLDFEDWRNASTGFGGLMAYTPSSSAVRFTDGTETVQGLWISSDFFEVLGVQMALGRSFTEEEDQEGGPDAVVLSWEFYRDRFAGDPSVLGRTLEMDGVAVPVVGVTPPDFGFPESERRFYRPLKGESLLARAGLPVGSRTVAILDVVGRLQPELDLAAARPRLEAAVTAIDRETGTYVEGQTLDTALLHDRVVGDIGGTLFFVLAAAFLVLVVAGANVTSLTMGRARARQREWQVRVALGSPRSRLFTSLMAESLVLAIVSGVLGVALGGALVHFLVQVAPADLPRLDEVGLSAASIALSGLATLLVAFAFGFLPALGVAAGARRSSIVGPVRGATADPASLKVQRGIVVTQVAFAVVLLSAGALLVNSFVRLSGVDPGFEPTNLVVVELVPGDALPDEESIGAFFGSLMDRVRALPGVESATATYSPPYTGLGFHMAFVSQDAPDNPRDWFRLQAIRSDYFETMDIELVDGAVFEGRERTDEPLVAIVNRSLAERYWPEQSAVGRQLIFTGGVRGGAESFGSEIFRRVPYTVVGVVDDVRSDGLSGPPEPTVYRPHGQHPWSGLSVIARGSGDLLGTAAAIRSAVWELEPDIAVQPPRLYSDHVAESLALPRFRMILVAGFAALGSFLAMTGLYALLALMVGRRRREIGIRIALGAGTMQVQARILGGAAGMVMVGLALGLGAAISLGETLAAMLFQVSPSDILTLVAVGATTLATAAIAAWVPARQASRVDPVESLRE